MPIWGHNNFRNQYQGPIYDLSPSNESEMYSAEQESFMDFHTNDIIEPSNFDIQLIWIEQISDYLTSLFLLILLIDKFFIRKDYKISNKEIGFMFLLLLKIQFPIISLATALLSMPPAFKAVKRWFKNNVNKRAELEAELRLLTQI